MLSRQAESVQCGKVSRASSVFEAQIRPDTPHKARDTALEWQRATQKEQISRLYRLNVCAKGRGRMRQADAKVSQPFLCCTFHWVWGHNWLSNKWLPSTEMHSAVDVQHFPGNLSRFSQVEDCLGDVAGGRNLSER